MLKVDWIGHGIVIVDDGNGNVDIRYLISDFLRGTGYSEAEERLVRALFDLRAVGVEARQTTDGRWEANATVEVDAWTVVPHKGEGNTLSDALRNLICDVVKKD
jgi:CheY-like chemotaxis protein